MNVNDIKEENQKMKIEKIKEIEEKTPLQVIMFCASWCSHCRSVLPKMEELAKEHTDIEFSKIDVDTADDALLDKFAVD